MKINQEFLKMFATRDDLPWLSAPNETLLVAQGKLEWLENTSLSTPFPDRMPEEERLAWLAEIFEKHGVPEFVREYPQKFPDVAYWAFISRLGVSFDALSLDSGVRNTTPGLAALLADLPPTGRDIARSHLISELQRDARCVTPDEAALHILALFHRSVTFARNNDQDFARGMRAKAGNTPAGDVLVGRVINRFIKAMFIF